jgi:phosphatidylglycerophosphate synthase
MPSFHTATAIERWSLVNAIGMLGATAGAVRLNHTAPLLIGGIGLLVVLVVIGRDRWTPQGDFGSANIVTALRVGLLCGLPYAVTAGPILLIGLSVCILATDGLDGWLARRSGRSSTFGAFFDKETDALFLLLLCGLSAFHERLPMWILGVGLLRYGFVLLLFLPASTETTEARSNLARYAYAGMLAALLSSFLPYPMLYRPLVILAATALTVSFGRSVWEIVSRQPASETP